MFSRLLILIACLTCLAGTVHADPITVTIVHFNDLDQMSGNKERGGIARLATLIKSERAKGGIVLATFAGDTISPSLMSSLDQGAHMIALLNRLDLTAMSLGNHEFDFGPEVAIQRIAEAGFPVLSANSKTPEGELLKGAVPSITVEAGRFRIGILGLTTTGTAEKSKPGNIVFEDPAKVAEAESAALRRAGADLVIALAHTDIAEDRQLIRQRAVDILLSGDDHLLATEYDDDMLFVESGAQAQWVTVITLNLDERERRGSMKFGWSAQYRVVDTALVEPDPEMAEAVSRYEMRLDKALDRELGVTLAPLDSRPTAIRNREAAIANLFTDAIRAATGADISLLNGGGIRADRVYSPGTTLTRRDIQSELPFGNKTMLITVTGQDVIDMLENGFSQLEKSSGRFPHVSGIAVTYDPARKPHDRVVAVLRDGKPIDLDATYTLAVNDFLAGGGDGYDLFIDKPRIIDEQSALEMTVQIFQYISDRGSVSPGIEGRINTVSD